jgi:hypothetical protein
MKAKLMISFIVFVSLATAASADVTPPWWCFDTPGQGQFCGQHTATTAELASIRAADQAEAKMCTALDCVQSANNGIGPAVHVSRNVGFKVIKSKAVIVDDGAVHHFTLIKAQ